MILHCNDLSDAVERLVKKNYTSVCKPGINRITVFAVLNIGIKRTVSDRPGVYFVGTSIGMYIRWLV